MEWTGICQNPNSLAILKYVQVGYFLIFRPVWIEELLIYFEEVAHALLQKERQRLSNRDKYIRLNYHSQSLQSIPRPRDVVDSNFFFCVQMNMFIQALKEIALLHSYNHSYKLQRPKDLS